VSGLWWLCLLYYICHLSRLAVTSRIYNIARYLENVHRNVDLGTAWLVGLPLCWLEPLSKGPQFKKSVQIAIVQLPVLKAEAMVTGDYPETSDSSFRKWLLFDKYLWITWTSIENPLLVLPITPLKQHTKNHCSNKILYLTI